MIKFKLNSKKYKSTPLTDKILVLFGTTGAVIVFDYLVSIQDNINIFIK